MQKQQKASKKQIISVDAGRFQTKVSADGQTAETFPSIVGEFQPDTYETIYHDFSVTLDGEKSLLGHKARIQSRFPVRLTTESKIHGDTKLLVLSSVAHVLDLNAEDFSIVTCMPIDDFNSETKQSLLNILCGKHSIVVNDKIVDIELEDSDIKIAPEGVAAYYNHVYDRNGDFIENHELLSGVVRVLDLGSRVMNFCTFNDGSYIPNASKSFKYGVIEALDDRFEPKSPEALKGFFRKVYASISNLWFDFGSDDVLLISGGGCYPLYEHFTTHFSENKIFCSKNPEVDNVLGAYKLVAGKE